MLRLRDSSAFALHETEEKVPSTSTESDPEKITPQAQETSKSEDFFTDYFLLPAWHLEGKIVLMLAIAVMAVR